MRGFWDYLKALGRHWKAFALTGAVPAVIGITASALDLKVPLSVWVGCFLLGLIVAQYRTYQDRRPIPGLSMRPEARVAGRRDSGLDLRESLITDNYYDDAVKALYNNWYAGTLGLLEEVAPTYAGEFRRGGWNAGSVIGISDPRLSDLIMRLDWRLERLGGIIQAMAAEGAAVSPANQN